MNIDKKILSPVEHFLQDQDNGEHKLRSEAESIIRSFYGDNYVPDEKFKQTVLRTMKSLKQSQRRFRL
jgi:hypothetical protein